MFNDLLESARIVGYREFRLGRSRSPSLAGFNSSGSSTCIMESDLDIAAGLVSLSPSMMELDLLVRKRDGDGKCVIPS